MTRAACYARYSSDLQRATSIEDQIALARRYAEQQGWTLLENLVYTDAAVSGSTLDGRPGIQALLADAASKPRPFDVLLVDDSSRIARDLRDALQVMRLLKFSRIRTIYISQQIDSSSEQAETLLTVHGLVDGLYLRELSQKTKRGLAGQLERGFATGGATYGYRTVPVLDPEGKRDASGQPLLVGKRPEVNDEEARVVRKILERYAAGTGTNSIVTYLNRAGISGPRGRRWRRGAVQRVLANERYVGRQIWGQRTYQRQPGTGRRVERLRPRHEWRMADRPDLRIVSDELWARVQQRRKDVAEIWGLKDGRTLVHGRNAALYSPHLFSGFMTCGVCGTSVHTVSGGAGSPRYGCPNSWRNGVAACDNRLTVRAKIADPRLLDGLQRELLRPELVTYLTNAVTAELNRQIDTRPQRRQELREQQETIRGKLGNLVSAVEGGVLASSLVQAIGIREMELQRTEAELVALDEPLDDKLAVIPAWVSQHLQDLAGLLTERPEVTKAELGRLGIRFTLYPVRDEGSGPFLRAVGEGTLPCFQISPDLPSAARVRSRQ